MLQAGRELLLLRLPVRLIDLDGLARGESFEQELVEALLVPPLVVGPDQVQNVFPDAAEICPRRLVSARRSSSTQAAQFLSSPCPFLHIEEDTPHSRHLGQSSRLKTSDRPSGYPR